MNKYIEKIAESLSKEAGIGEVGKALIRTKLAPAMAKKTVGQASSIEGISRAFTGSKVAPRIFSTPEMAQHSTAMAGLGKKLVPSGGMSTSQTSKVLAVAARARKMGVIKPA